MKLLEVLNSKNQPFILDIENGLEFPDEKMETAKDFIQFCCDELGITGQFKCYLCHDKEKNGVTPLDLLNPMTKHASDELATSRMSICQGCPELIKLTSQCKKCGCIMRSKVTLPNAECPIGKWGQNKKEEEII